jgi:hypothetical protein
MYIYIVLYIYITIYIIVNVIVIFIICVTTLNCFVFSFCSETVQEWNGPQKSLWMSQCTELPFLFYNLTFWASWYVEFVDLNVPYISCKYHWCVCVCVCVLCTLLESNKVCFFFLLCWISDIYVELICTKSEPTALLFNVDSAIVDHRNVRYSKLCAEQKWWW